MKKITLSILFIQLMSITIDTIDAASPSRLAPIVVTATRESKSINEISDAISTASTADIEHLSPTHPSELVNRYPGVHVNDLGGEGHMTAIRQPITTKGVYLFLEDGIPTRPTGLFNHNALYEINLPQADRIEIIKGPGSALYGSDSIGGIINSITRPTPSKTEITIHPELASFGWNRWLLSIGGPINDDLGIRIDLNTTNNEGFRDSSNYRRLSTTSRLDGFINDYTQFKTILSITKVNQSGVSSLSNEDYINTPKFNEYHNDVGRRIVDALRLSTEFSYEPNPSQHHTLTPFFRNNQMKLMPSWMLGYDPNDRTYEFQSYGLLAKSRFKLPDSSIEFITGVDFDFSPSTYTETRIKSIKSNDIITSTSPTGRTNYHYDANQLSISPYVHGEWQALENLRLNTGLRYDYFSLDYNDLLSDNVPQSQGGQDRFTHYRPASQSISYTHLSPKLGAIYQLSDDHQLYTNARHSFRVPSIGQLFRSGSTTNTSDLKPVKTNSVDLGFRGRPTDWLTYDVTIYSMIVEDDIVSYIDDSDRKITNAGKTTHRGVELGLTTSLSEEWRIKKAWSFTDQTYNDYTALVGFPVKQINYSGKTVAKSPQSMGHISIEYRPSYLPTTLFELEWNHLGQYYTDETNTQTYPGHSLFNFRLNHALSKSTTLVAKALNLTDERTSTYTSNRVGDNNIQYRPGLPRQFYLGVKAQL